MKWCNYFNCWCDNVEEIIEDSTYCDFDCEYCDEMARIE
jgi:hypothetical protein